MTFDLKLRPAVTVCSVSDSVKLETVYHAFIDLFFREEVKENASQ